MFELEFMVQKETHAIIILVELQWAKGAITESTEEAQGVGIFSW